MTPEEIEAKMSELEAKTAKLEELEQKNAELEKRLPQPPQDPDLQYKPKSWQELHETVDSKAEAAALKVLKEAEEKKEQMRKDEEKLKEEQAKMIDDTLAKLQEEGIITETKTENDEGFKQRRQILGMALRSGSTNVDAVARQLKTAWDGGLEYDVESNSYVAKGGQPNTARMAPVGSPSARTQSAPTKNLDLRGVNGDLEEAARRWSEVNK